MTASAVLYVKHLDRMRDFYQQCFGFEVAETTEDYSVVTSNAWTLSLVAIPADTAATITISVPPRRRADVPIKLAFEVSSIEALRPVVAGRGGQIDAKTGWEFRGFRHCDGVDPEGNILQLLEPLTEPE